MSNTQAALATVSAAAAAAVDRYYRRYGYSYHCLRDQWFRRDYLHLI